MIFDIFKISAVVGCIVVVGFSVCCHVNLSRFEDERAVIETRAIRDAERVYKQKTGHYGTIDDLTGDNMIDFDPGTGLTSRFAFECTAQSNAYRLAVREKPGSSNNNDRSEVFSIYVDETGIITVSYKPDRPADRDSFPLHDQ